MDVQAWRNKQELERALVSLVEQPGTGAGVSKSASLGLLGTFAFEDIFDE